MTSLLEPDSKTQTKYEKYEISSWDDENLSLDTKLLRGIYAFGFEKPSAIQCKALHPMITTGRDIIAQAQSGTGKTGAFTTGVLQILSNLGYKSKDNKTTSAIILAPTHELAKQTKDVLEKIGRFMKITVQLLVGGTSVENDKKNLTENTPHIVVGTPGRLSLIHI